MEKNINDTYNFTAGFRYLMILLLPVIFLCTGCGKREVTYFNPDTDPYIRESDRIDFDVST